jgi:hypothetical protein
VTPEAVFAEIQGLGLHLSRRGDKLRLEPRAAVTREVVERVRALKNELLALVDTNDVSWRLAAMLPQIPDVGPVRGLLTAREGAWPADGSHCVSCGDLLPARCALGPFGIPLRCAHCQEAARLAIESRRRRRRSIAREP